MNLDLDKLLHAVTYYLSYQEKIGRAFMINESSLKYPVADYLTSLEMPLKNIKLEYSHPELKKRQIDLITIDSYLQVKYAFEFKVARPTTRNDVEQKRIFNDLMRLYLLKKSTCYFIIAGKFSDFIQNFRSIVSSKPTTNSNTDLPIPQGFYSEWFEFKVNGVKTFDVKNTSKQDYKQIYQAFVDDYKPKGNVLDLPDKISTKCVAISALSREFPTPYVGGIWKIQ
jgi:hypothetical protein